MRRSPLLAVAVALSLAVPAGAGTPLWVETYPTMPGTQNSIDSEPSGTVVAVVGGNTVVVSKDSGLTWAPLSPLSSPPNGGSSHTRVSPATPTTWFAENGGAVSATTDAGATWKRRAVPPVVRDPRERFEYATEVGAADGTAIAAVGWSGARVVGGCPYSFRFTPIFVTHDGGARWRRTDLPVSGHIEAISWFDRRRATAVVLEFDWPEPERDGNECGSTGYLQRSSLWTTTDGGVSWRRSYTTAGPALLAASWSSPTTVSVLEEVNAVGRTRVSNDGGRTYSRPVSLYDLKGVNGFPAMQFTAGRRGWVGAIVAGVFRSDTAGAEWTHEVSPADGAIYGVPDLTAVSRDAAVYAGPRTLVTRAGEAPVARAVGTPDGSVRAPSLVTTRLGDVSSVLTLPVRGLPTLEWRAAPGA